MAAIGRPAFVTREFVKPGATVIDVGINTLTIEADVERIFPAGSRKRAAFAEKGSVLVGDVHPDVEEVAGALTPVPGGVGPLTVAMVLRNTVTAAELRAQRKGGDVIRKIALTGGIATGKSYVADSPARGRRAAWSTPTSWRAKWWRPASPALAAIRKRFGPDAVRRDGTMDRVRVAQIVFKDKRARLDLEAIIHPAVIKAINEFFDGAAQADAVCGRRHSAALRDRTRQGIRRGRGGRPARARCSCSG